MEVWSIFIVCLMLGAVGCLAACKLYVDSHKEVKIVHVLNI